MPKSIEILFTTLLLQSVPVTALLQLFLHFPARRRSSGSYRGAP